MELKEYIDKYKEIQKEIEKLKSVQSEIERCFYMEDIPFKQNFNIDNKTYRVRSYSLKYENVTLVEVDLDSSEYPYLTMDLEEFAVLYTSQKGEKDND